MRLILVRHGQTDYNREGRYQGQRGVPLNATGAAQARRLAARLACERVVALVSSDLPRCVQTVEPIAGALGLDAARDPRWRELSFGRWEGMTHPGIQAAAPELLDEWQRDPAATAPPGGETLAQLAARAASALEELKVLHAGGTVLAVTHGGVIRALLCLALGIDLNRHWQFGVDSASVTEVSYYEQGAILNRFNDTSHLGD